MKLLKRVVVSMFFVAICSSSVAADDFLIQPGDVSLFPEIVTEAARLTAYRSMVSAEPGGVAGFDIGVAITGVEVDSALWEQFINESESGVAIPRIMVRKGLPLNIDVGAFYADVSDYDLTMQGFELQWALLDGTLATPALSLRGSYTELDASGEMEVETTAADLVISKGLAMVTPYAGVGIVNFEGKYTGSDPIVQALISDYDDDETRFFAGLQFAIALLNITAEYEQMDEPVYSLKMSLGW